MAIEYDACPSCDSAVMVGSRFCNGCGVKLNEAIELKRTQNQESWLKTKLIDWGVMKDGTEETGETESTGEAAEAGEAEGDGEADDDSGNGGTFEVY